VDETTLNWETFLLALALSYNTSYHSTLASTPFELLFGEKARLFPNEDIQKLHYCETLVAECFNLLQKLRQKAHQFTSENGKKQKNTLTKTLVHTSLMFFYKGKNPKLAPNFKGPDDIIDINDSNTKVKIGNKIKVLNVEKLKLFLDNQTNETDTDMQDLKFNDEYESIRRACAKLIKYKEAAQLALLILNEEGVARTDAIN